MNKDIARIKHMIDVADEIAEIVSSGNESRPMERAIERLIEIFGEAANHISEDVKSENQDIPWRDITDARNFLIHEYFDVQMSIVWSIAKARIPEIKFRLKEILEEIEK